MRTKRLLVLFLAALTVPVGAGLAVAASANSPTAAARAATDRYHDISLAIADGYGEFRDAAGIACIEQPGVGAMGVHYVRGSLVGDTVLDPTQPEALVYEPRPYRGGYKLVALEYIVFKDAWDRVHGANAAPPQVFGQPLLLSSHSFVTNGPSIPHYELHVWLHSDNPNGMFAPWNPVIGC